LLLILPGLFLAFRYLYYAAIGQGAGHIQSVILSAVLLIVGFQTLLIGLLADLIGFNRIILEDLLYRLRRIELERPPSRSSTQRGPRDGEEAHAGDDHVQVGRVGYQGGFGDQISGHGDQPDAGTGGGETQQNASDNPPAEGGHELEEACERGHWELSMVNCQLSMVNEAEDFLTLTIDNQQLTSDNSVAGLGDATVIRALEIGVCNE